MSNFTAGPWWTDETYSENEAGIAVIAANTDCARLPGNPTRGMVAFVTELLIDRAAICQANARLIAAAPDLYVSLTTMVERWRPISSGPDRQMYEDALRVLAKVEGAVLSQRDTK